jgi:Tol biopolymer transport system component
VGVAVLAIGIISSGSTPSLNRAAVAYVTGTKSSGPWLWLMGDEVGARRKLGAGDAPLLSPSGAFVAASVAASRGPALVVYSSNGSVLGRFFDLAHATALALAWSRDSRYLAIELSSTDPISDASSGLAILDTETDSYRILAYGPIYGASFAPDRSGRVAYASASSTALSARVDISMVDVNGSARARLTHDGRSLNPVWGRNGIAFDRERLRSGEAPAYQLWSMSADGSGARQISHLTVPPTLNGPVPLGFSADGSRLLVEYEGQDTSQAWTVVVGDGRLHRLVIDGHSVAGAAISTDGRSVLVDHGGFLNQPDDGVVESVPFNGGPARIVVAHGSQPSWNL